MNYVCDFETSYSEELNKSRVWLVCLMSEDEECFIGDCISDFIHFCEIITHSATMYFHNLAFDGKFIIAELLRRGYKFTTDKDCYTDKHFTCLIDYFNTFYSVTIIVNNHKIKIYDSLKKIPLPVSKIANAYSKTESKGLIDYDSYRDVGYQATQEEIDYVISDCRIVLNALKQHWSLGMKKMTLGSDCLSEFFKLMGGKKNFRKTFPSLEELYLNGMNGDDYCRKAYKGGWCYCNPKYANKEVGKGLHFDVNSLYPSRMYYEEFPVGIPIFCEGEYTYDEDYPLYIAHIHITFDIKDNNLPCIQIKNTKRFAENEWLLSSNGDSYELYVTSVDLELIKENYDCDIVYIDYLKFHSLKGIFKKYIDKYMNLKKESEINKNDGMRQIAKLFLNNLYGKFGQSVEGGGKEPYLVDNVLKFKDAYEDEPAPTKESIYTALAAFVTAYARAYTIRAAQANYDRFLYSDTDSLALLGTEPPIGMIVDDLELGAWKEEERFENGKFLRQKTYCEVIKGKLHLTCAGFKKEFIVKNDKGEYERIDRDKYYTEILGLTIEDFKLGLVIKNGKSMSKTVEGGVDIRSTDFRIIP